MSDMDNNPLAGLGDEMIPDKGLPFDDIDEIDIADSLAGTDPLIEDELLNLEEERRIDFASNLEPRDLTPEELAEIGVDMTSQPATPGEELPNDFIPSDLAGISELLDDDFSLEATLSEDELTEIVLGNQNLSPEFESTPEFQSASSETDISPEALAAAILGAGNTEEGAFSLEAALGGDEAPPADFAESGMNAGADMTGELPAVDPISEIPLPTPEALSAMDLLKDPEFQLSGLGLSAPGSAPQLAGDLQPDQKNMSQLIKDEQRQKLWDRIEQTQQQINQFIDDLKTARELHDQIRSAKTLLLAGDQNFEEAERALVEAEYKIAFVHRLREWTKKYQLRIGGYLVFIGIIFGVGFVFLPQYISNLVTAANNLFIIPEDIGVATGAMMWGGLGGVVGGLITLRKHISIEQDFNPQHNLWYYMTPVVGIPIGAFIFTFMKLSFNSIQVDTQNSTLFFMLATYALSFLAGLEQNVFYNIIKQVSKLFKVELSKEG